jgi:hypothetical protein
MRKPKQLSEKRKQWMRKNFSGIDPGNLANLERSYYNKIKAGKARAKKAIRIEGKYLSGEILDIVAKVAVSKGKTTQEYIDENREAIVTLIHTGYTHVSKDIDKAIDVISDMKRKTVEVDTGNGIVRMTKQEAIEQLSTFQQHVKSTTNIVMAATTIKTYKNNKIEITIPDQSDYEDLEGVDLIEFLDGFPELFYIRS